MINVELNPFEIFNSDLAIVAAGEKGDYNGMTIAWGGMGTLWSRPVVTVYVKKTRYTHEFLEKNDYFTVSFYPEKYKKALMVMGSVSGRDTDKAAQAGLTPEYLKNSVTFQEASMTFVCRKIYSADLNPEDMDSEAWDQFYRNQPEPHTMYIGEVVDFIEKN